MVGFGVAGYTGIIERGIEQLQGAKPMTTKQNPNVSMLDEDLKNEGLGRPHRRRMGCISKVACGRLGIYAVRGC